MERERNWKVVETSSSRVGVKLKSSRARAKEKGPTGGQGRAREERRLEWNRKMETLWPYWT